MRRSMRRIRYQRSAVGVIAIANEIRQTYVPSVLAPVFEFDLTLYGWLVGWCWWAAAAVAKCTRSVGRSFVGYLVVARNIST